MKGQSKPEERYQKKDRIANLKTWEVRTLEKKKK